MINVVFLLLIFFLMSAQIRPPAPLEVSAPVSQSSTAPTEDLRLYIDAEGTLALREVQGPQVWTVLADTTDPGRTPLVLEADAALPAATLARILTQASGLGFGQIQLVTARP